MARIRTVKPEFWSHPIMGKLDDAAKCLALALLNFADDEGFFLAEPNLVRSTCRPFDDDSTMIRRCLDTLVESEWITLKIHPSHGPIGQITKFSNHQRIDRPNPSTLKNYFLDDQSTINRRSIDDQSTQEGKGKEGKGKESTYPTLPKGRKLKLKLSTFSPQATELAFKIKEFWPDANRGAVQPDHNRTPVPIIKMPLLGDRLTELIAQGCDPAILEAIAKRVVQEWRDGNWIKAPQHFFGKSEDAPWSSYYKAHLTNEAE